MRALTGIGKPQLALGVALALSLAIGLGLAADWTDDRSADSTTGGPMFAARQATAGPVQVKVTPLRLDDAGARFNVVLDNHEIDLTMDLAGAALLTVGSARWGPAAWSGDGPGGHHREGTLSFGSRGPAAGDAVLTLGGLSSPVRLTWQLPEGGTRS